MFYDFLLFVLAKLPSAAFAFAPQHTKQRQPFQILPRTLARAMIS